MAEGEFAVLFSGDRPETVEGEATPEGPFCVVAADMADAERYAREVVVLYPTMITRVYDRRGMVGAPLFEAHGAKANHSEISARFRRWAGGSLFGVGAALGLAEIISGFTINWAGMLAARLLPVGVVLLLTEAAIVVGARREQKRKPR
ncbi:hypothetical protein [Terriglobus albidus]|uniref:hypothetical protein n=1 Tax=Terriglobus albidus TaxID=1592106 RepID=UPI0021DF4556|nr:hypothetical protein [Terriglobus albidus]